MNPRKDNIPSETSSSVLPRDRTLLFLILFGAFLCGVSILGLGIREFYFSSASPGPEAAESFSSSVAILPFAYRGPDEGDFLGVGISDDILTYLTRFEDLKVISRHSSGQYVNTGLSTSEIGARLDARYILEGSLRREDNRIVVHASLVDSREQRNLWAERYERPRNQLQSIQREIAQSIARELDLLPRSETEAYLPSSPAAAEAYVAILRGKHLMQERTREGLEKGLTQFYLAIALDSTSAEAYLGLAEAHFVLSDLRYSEDHDQHLAQVDILANRAIQLDAENGKAYALLGALYEKQYRYEEMLAAYETALSLQPNDALINYWYSLRLRSVGLLDRALQYHRLASELDPLHPVIQAGYVYTCALAGQFELADQILARTEPILEQSFLFYFARGNTYLQRGEYAAALPDLRKAITLNPRFQSIHSDKFYCLGKLGELDSVRHYVNTLDAKTAIGQLRTAKAWLSVDELDKARRHFASSAEMGLIPDDLLPNSIYDPMRNTPEYRAVIRRFGLEEFVNL